MTDQKKNMLQFQKLGILVAVGVFIADQASKWWILDVFKLQERVSEPLLSFLSFTMVWNRGISMGFFSAESDLGRWMLILVTGAIAIYLSVWLWKGAGKFVSIALGAVIGGAIGNIIDRIIHGAVVDFVHLHAFEYSFYVFNVADAGISIGVIILLLDSLRNDDKSRKRTVDVADD